MFLKRAVLHGFKSFADRTEFEFGAGVTTVVGPNGCGKSNVLDAVRWVLGEQSARSLRGGRMLDVIFSGSRSRKPANCAHVELVFDNTSGILRCDETEVTVGRLLYRSGDAEYRLNGKSCRLKDIRELLLDTGVGVDAYSAIEQGRVDSLLQASPAQRREIFEEAAGISRYKVRRAEAQRKLERAQNNLLRLQDVIDELEKRLRSVRLAAGKARNFQQYDARLRELRASFSMAEFHELEQARQRTEEQIQELREALNEERVRLADGDANAAELSQAIQARDEEIQAADADLLELQTSCSALEERLAQLERRLEELATTRQRRGVQSTELAERLTALQQRVVNEEALVRRHAELEEERAQQAAELQGKQAAAEQGCQAARQTLEAERAAAYEAVRRASLLQNEYANIEQQHGRLGAQVERLATRQREIDEEQAQLEQQSTELDQHLGELENQTTTLADQVRDDEECLVNLREEATRLDAQVSEAKETRSALTSRRTLLEDMERRLEGVDQGTQAVLGWREEVESAGVLGLVADLLRIDEPRVAALQTVLASFEDHVVVRDTQTFLDELENRGAPPGAVRVLGLDRLVHRSLAPGYEGVPGFVARASEWVSCPTEYRPLAEHLLGRTIIVETLTTALRLASEALAGYAFVSIDGWTVFADGRLIHGTAGATGGLISRKAEIRQLASELEEIETALVARTRRRLEVEQATSDRQLRRQAALEEIATLQRQQAESRAQRTRIEDARQRLQRELTVTRGEMDTHRRALAELEEQRQRLGGERAAVADAQQAHEDRVRTLAEELAEQESSLTRLAQEHTAALVEKGRAAEKRTASEEALKELRDRCQTLSHSAADAQREAEEAAEQIEAAKEQRAQSQAKHAEQQAAAEASHAQVVQLREGRQSLRQELEQCGAASRAIQQRIDAGEATLHEQQVALRETEVRREGLVNRVREELDLELEAHYASYEHADQDWAAIRAEIEDLRGKIARLGNVNLDAITELEELTPRYEHLMEQRTDLVDSIERLEGLITELDTESKARFAETFNQVRQNFQELFRKLFGGGKADIILEQPENPLECGIEIIARPPGKEPQSISLLSGGEKTMTAVALLMAVFKSRPSPFAILDEVDAALDEANTERFNTLLQEFLSTSQFVVITHSKRTMACADVLYGITMEEPGVSKRVSVRFEDRVHTPDVA